MKNTTAKRATRIPLKNTALDKVFPFIVKYNAKHNMAPTLGEVADKFGKSVEWVRHCYKVLVKAKLIKIDHYKQRGITIK